MIVLQHFWKLCYTCSWWTMLITSDLGNKAKRNSWHLGCCCCCCCFSELCRCVFKRNTHTHTTTTTMRKRYKNNEQNWKRSIFTIQSAHEVMRNMRTHTHSEGKERKISNNNINNIEEMPQTSVNKQTNFSEYYRMDRDGKTGEWWTSDRGNVLGIMKVNLHGHVTTCIQYKYHKFNLINFRLWVYSNIERILLLNFAFTHSAQFHNYMSYLYEASIILLLTSLTLDTNATLSNRVICVFFLIVC